ncbi:DUF998 domain-containing protein [Planctobacterium marinum]|uniref:DUF998 domain-containing protein n=1 Tax=Planctobacterium marinum TaxID=1631968 RepID=UPI001E30FCC2|nr:DUF998 domain-containing protein [Planctobacterium marinum]MCC2605978.1 DUF998 domain-containing protein [Planctobacterium marinum]
MKQLDYWLIKQAHLIWLVSIINIGIGVIIPGFDFLAKSISHVALEAPVFAIIHRTADIVIGLSMCGFACAISRTSPNRFSLASLSTLLLGLSMISAGIWTLETPLHLLYNLSIFMIIVPLAFALEFKNRCHSLKFEYLCMAITCLHVFMFWLIYAGFIPAEFNGLVQRLWAIPTMGWFGVAAYRLLQRNQPDNPLFNNANTDG